MIEIRSEFVKIARQFAAGVTGVNELYLAKRGEIAIGGIYVEPAPAGGVYIIGTDASALCVHYEREGKADRPYLIKGLTREHDKVLHNGAPSHDRWLVVANKNLGVRTPDGDILPLHGVTLVPADRVGNKPPPGTAAFPDWHKVVPSRAQIARMKQGYPFTLNGAYLSILARLFDYGNGGGRAVQIRSHGTIDKPVVLTFPWRPDLTIVIQSFVISESTDQPDPAAVLHDGFDVPETPVTPEQPEEPATPDEPEGGWGDEDWDDEEEDEAAGL